MAQTRLTVVARKGDVNPPVHMREHASCEFCSEPCWINIHNLRELRSQKITPVIICITCYQQGAHIKQGYRQ